MAYVTILPEQRKRKFFRIYNGSKLVKGGPTIVAEKIPSFC